MALGKHYEEIIERRRANGARVVFEYLHPQETCTVVHSIEMFGMSPTKFKEFRDWITRMHNECLERLSREMTFVYKLNEERTRAWTVGYMTKGEATKIAPVVGGMLLDLDNVYRGILVVSNHLFVSEAKLADGLQRYGSKLGPWELVESLVAERQAA